MEPAREPAPPLPRAVAGPGPALAGATPLDGTRPRPAVPHNSQRLVAWAKAAEATTRSFARAGLCVPEPETVNSNGRRVASVERDTGVGGKKNPHSANGQAHHNRVGSGDVKGARHAVVCGPYARRSQTSHATAGRGVAVPARDRHPPNAQPQETARATRRRVSLAQFHRTPQARVKRAQRLMNGMRAGVESDPDYKRDHVASVTCVIGLRSAALPVLFQRRLP